MSNYTAIQDDAILYLKDGQSLCEIIDNDVELFAECEKAILSLQKDINMKRKLVTTKAFIVLTIFFIFFFNFFLFIPALKISSLFFLLAFILGILASCGFHLLIKKVLLKKAEVIYKEAIEKIYEKASELVEDMFLHRNFYEEMLLSIPKHSRHPVAMDIMRQSLENDFTYDIDDATDFYEKRYDILCKKTDENAAILLNEIKNSENISDERMNLLLNLEEKVSLYNL